jgi:hypothetical protein
LNWKFEIVSKTNVVVVPPPSPSPTTRAKQSVLIFASVYQNAPTGNTNKYGSVLKGKNDTIERLLEQLNK